MICCQVCSCCLPGSSSIAVFNEPASFNEPKPRGLSVTDDTWASLKLRVDPLARHILDPHRSYVGATFLALFVSTVFTAVRPGWHIVNLSSYYDQENAQNDWDGQYGGEGEGDDAPDDDDYLDDDYYSNNGMDDIVLREYAYRNEELAHAMVFWRIGFIASLSILFLATVTVAVGMELKNDRYDAKIRNVIDEMRKRFETEGYEIGYRTRTEISGVLFGHLRPQRIIYFKRIQELEYSPPKGVTVSSSATGKDPGSTAPASDGHGIGSSASSEVSPPSFNSISSPGMEGDQSQGGIRIAEDKGDEVVFVEVPEGRQPGQLVTVVTPSGDHIMVAIPSGTRPGQSFPVLVPPKLSGGGGSAPPPRAGAIQDERGKKEGSSTELEIV